MGMETFWAGHSLNYYLEIIRIISHFRVELFGGSLIDGNFVLYVHWISGSSFRTIALISYSVAAVEEGNGLLCRNFVEEGGGRKWIIIECII